jgi:hypothetical protein
MRGAGFMAGGNLLGAPTPPAELTALLRRDAGSYTWAAATIGSNSAAGYQLASGEPVMALGGFNGGRRHGGVRPHTAAVSVAFRSWHIRCRSATRHRQSST